MGFLGQRVATLPDVSPGTLVDRRIRDGTYKLTDKLGLYAGIRWTQDKGELRDFQVLGAGAPIIPLQPTKRYDNSAPTGRVE